MVELKAQSKKRSLVTSEFRRQVLLVFYEICEKIRRMKGGLLCV